MRGPHRWLPLLGWCAATLAAVAVASVALVPVLRTATSSPASALPELPGEPAGDYRDLSRSASPSPTATPSPTAASPTLASPTDSRAPGGGQPTSSGGATSSGQALPDPAEPPASPASSATTTTDDGWTVTRGEGGESTYLRSFHLEGGRSVIRASDGVVELVSATPSSGFAVAVVQDTPDNLAVYFNEVNHSFIVHVVWQDGRPLAMVSEVGS